MGLSLIGTVEKYTFNGIVTIRGNSHVYAGMAEVTKNDKGELNIYINNITSLSGKTSDLDEFEDVIVDKVSSDIRRVKKEAEEKSKV